MTDYKRLTHHPLEFVLTEIRFSAVLNLKEYVAKIQDRVRADYPIFKREQEQSVNINPNGINVEQTDKYAFVSKQGDSAFILTTNRVIFMTKSYDRFDDFLARTEKVLRVVNDVLSPAVYHRIGLRFSDCIKSSEQQEESLYALLNGSELLFNPQLATIGGKGVQKNETLVVTEHGHLVVRSVLAVLTAKLFDDLVSQTYVPIKADSEPSLRLLLDFDHFWENHQEPRDFEMSAILACLEGLHEKSREAFWKLTSDKARNETWS